MQHIGNQTGRPGLPTQATPALATGGAAAAAQATPIVNRLDGTGQPNILSHSPCDLFRTSGLRLIERRLSNGLMTADYVAFKAAEHIRAQSLTCLAAIRRQVNAKYSEGELAEPITQDIINMANKAANALFNSAYRHNLARDTDHPRMALQIALDAVTILYEAVARNVEANFQTLADREVAVYSIRKSTAAIIDVCRKSSMPTVDELPANFLSVWQFSKSTIDSFLRVFSTAATQVSGPDTYLIAIEAALCAATATRSILGRIYYCMSEIQWRHGAEAFPVKIATNVAKIVENTLFAAFVSTYNDRLANLASRPFALVGAQEIAGAISTTFYKYYRAVARRQPVDMALAGALEACAQATDISRVIFERALHDKAQLTDPETFGNIIGLATDTFATSIEEVARQNYVTDFDDALSVAREAAETAYSSMLSALREYSQMPPTRLSAHESPDQGRTTAALSKTIRMLHNGVYEGCLTPYEIMDSLVISRACITSKTLFLLAPHFAQLGGELGDLLNLIYDQILSNLIRSILPHIRRILFSEGGQACIPISSAYISAATEVAIAMFLKVYLALKPANPIGCALMGGVAVSIFTNSLIAVRKLNIETIAAIEIAEAIAQMAVAAAETVVVHQGAAALANRAECAIQFIKQNISSFALGLLSATLESAYNNLRLPDLQPLAFLTTKVITDAFSIARELSSSNLAEIGSNFRSMAAASTYSVFKVFTQTRAQVTAIGAAATGQHATAEANLAYAIFTADCVRETIKLALSKTIHLGYDANPIEVAQSFPAISAMAIVDAYRELSPFLDLNKTQRVAKLISAMYVLPALRLYSALIPHLRHVHTLRTTILAADIAATASSLILTGYIRATGSRSLDESQITNILEASSTAVRLTATTFEQVHAADAPNNGRRLALISAKASALVVRSNFVTSYFENLSSNGHPAALAIASFTAECARSRELQQIHKLPPDPSSEEQDNICRGLVSELQPSSPVNLTKLLTPLSARINVVLPALSADQNFAHDAVWEEHKEVFRRVIVAIANDNERERKELLAQFVDGREAINREGQHYHDYGWLEKLLLGKDAESLAGEVAVKQRIAIAIACLATLPVDTQRGILATLSGYSRLCPDEAVTGLTRLEMELRLALIGRRAATPQGRISAMAEIFIQMYKTHAVEELAGRINTGEESLETGLYLLLRYNRALGLEIPTQDLLFAHISRNGTGTYGHDLDLILRMMTDPNNILDFFAQVPETHLWRETLRTQALFDPADPSARLAYHTRVKSEIPHLSDEEIRTGIAAERRIDPATITSDDINDEINKRVDTEVIRRWEDFPKSVVPVRTRQILEELGYLAPQGH